jgi:hypothetical protein
MQNNKNIFFVDQIINDEPEVLNFRAEKVLPGLGKCREDICLGKWPIY